MAKEVLPPLLKHESIKVRLCAAAHCLGLNIFIDQAVAILESISNLNTSIFSFEAEMTLKVWREQGYLKVYQK